MDVVTPGNRIFGTVSLPVLTGVVVDAALEGDALPGVSVVGHGVWSAEINVQLQVNLLKALVVVLVAEVTLVLSDVLRGDVVYNERGVIFAINNQVFGKIGGGESDSGGEVEGDKVERGVVFAPDLGVGGEEGYTGWEDTRVCDLFTGPCCSDGGKRERGREEGGGRGREREGEKREEEEEERKKGEGDEYITRKYSLRGRYYHIR